LRRDAEDAKRYLINPPNGGRKDKLGELCAFLTRHSPWATAVARDNSFFVAFSLCLL